MTRIMHTKAHINQHKIEPWGQKLETKRRDSKNKSISFFSFGR